MLSIEAQRLAGKFGRTPGNPSNHFHPLICHMIDVAAVTEALWDRVYPPRLKSMLADGLGLDEPSARAWIAFIAGLHDLGKASKPFQAKLPGCHERLAGTRLQAAGIPDGADKAVGYHGLVSMVQLEPLFASLGVPGAVSLRLRTITGGHHGTFPLPDSDRGQGTGGSIFEGRLAADRDHWARARRELFEMLAEVAGIRGAGIPSTQPDNAPAMVLAGIVSVADWIGSAEDCFPYAPEAAGDPAAYAVEARKRAIEALTNLRWLAHSESSPRSFGELFRDDGGQPLQPRPLQQAADDLRRDVHGLGLVIIEAPMGEGKTEAALLLADHWNGSGSRGAYVALPTQATANQLHGRVKRFLRRAFPGHDLNLLLVHGAAPLRGDLEFLPSNIDEEHGDVAAGSWFVQSKKRSLLAPYGVGTVDQALMAVLQVKHVFVRLLGLAGKAIVIDEVHAYDTYMTGLLERLLEWLGALGSPVVLLSATLPTGRREALLRAYMRGSGGETVPAPGREAGEPVPYPRITWTTANEAGSRSFPASSRSTRILGLGQAPTESSALGTFLRERLADGGCAVVICNTVRSAQETYTALKEKSGFAADELGLFHARFVFEDRQRIEDSCLERFGPSAGEQRPPRFVLVATQVVEQSLDLDFDVMVSDPAPVDLLLQRAGRLQRHDRGERPGHPLTLFVRWPESPGGVPQFDGGTRAVYDEHVLLRTWHLLRDRPSIAIPGEMQELIDEVYGDDATPPADATPAVADRWQETWAEMEGKRDAERREADDRRLKGPAGVTLLSNFLQHSREEDAEDLHPAHQALTRLADPSVSVVILPPSDPAVTAPTVPGTKEAGRLLRRAVSVSNRGLVGAVLDRPVPAKWSRTAWLGRHRLVVLDEGEASMVGPYRLTYSRETGLRYERLDP